MSSKPSASPSPWLSYISDPAWLPHAYNASDDTLIFAHLPRESQRRAVFLDPRFLARAEKSSPVPVAEIPTAAVRDGAGPIHFIFHTAFCCSTLLARALDVPGVAMGVKEPSVLVSVTRDFATGRRRPGLPAALQITLDLLSRPLEHGETQVVKPSVVVNHAVPSFLHLRPDAKAIVLYSGLDQFLRAIVRRNLDGRAYARNMFRNFAAAIPLDTGYLPEDLFAQTDLQIAAQAWLMQMSFLESVVQRFGAARVRTLNSNSLLDDPAAVLEKVARFLELGLSATDAAAIAAGPVFQEHAKHAGVPFDAETHRAQLDQAGVVHFEELNAARAWARTLAHRCSVPTTLGDTLLA